MLVERLSHSGCPSAFALTLLDDPTHRFGLFANGDGVLAALPRAGLNEALVRAWARRFGVAMLDDVPRDAQLATAIRSLATVVYAPDAEVAGLARTYADAVGARLSPIADADSLARAIATEPNASSATVILLNENLDQPIVDALARGNAERVRSGRLPLSTGIITAFDPPKLAWLLAKTLVCLDLPVPPEAAIGRFDGSRGTVTIRNLADSAPAIELREPWIDPRTVAQSVVAHGAAFDLALGEVVLCSHLEPALPAARTAIAPSCFHDGICFRLGREDGPTVRRRAHEATPLFWGIDSCGTIPFRENAFGRGSSYALALLAGSAVAVIGSYLALTTSGLAARAFEALLEAGWSTGEIAAALGCVDHNAAEFNPYLCLGSPDLRVAALATQTGDAERGIVSVRSDGKDTVAVELAAERTELHDVIEDDGDDAWRRALARRVDAPGRAALVVAFDGSRRFAGKLRLAEAGAARKSLTRRCAELDRHLGMLAGYGFAAAHSTRISAVRASISKAAASASAEYAVRAIPTAAQHLLSVGEELLALEESVAESFVQTVLERDVSFDRESENGFVAGQLRRASARCHICHGPLYIALDRWAADESYLRLKATCPNCFGVAMRPESSPLASVVVAGVATGDEFRVRVTPRSAVDRPLGGFVAAAPRRGRIDDGAGVVRVAVPARGEAQVEFEFAASHGGVVTYRVLVLCEAVAELYTAIDAGLHRSDSASAKVVTVVGAELAGPGQVQPRGLNQTG
jgi:hypothetical protein